MAQDIQQVIDFVKRNRVKAKEGFICVDGRYHLADHAGMIARPGGNFRGIMALLALKDKLHLTTGRIVDKAVDAVESMGITFNMHTDEHEEKDRLSSIGCGHIAKAEDPKTAPLYKVNPRDVRQALVYLKIKLEGRKYYKLAALEGEHKEQGVLVITGTKYTVKHSDKAESQMYFVYDKTRDEEYTHKLWEKLNIPGLSWKSFSEMNELQLNATLKLLAKNLPIYEVNLDNKEPEVRYLGKVE